MIEGKDKKWHYEKTIEMWEEIVEKGLGKRETKIYKKYKPENACFLCEYHVVCKECPFNLKFPEVNIFECFGCCREDSPYNKWDDNRTTENAKEVLKWLKAELFR